jgi:hypothetical protein
MIVRRAMTEKSAMRRSAQRFDTSAVAARSMWKKT